MYNNIIIIMNLFTEVTEMTVWMIYSAISVDIY